MRKAIIAVVLVLVGLLLATLWTFETIYDGTFSLQVEVVIDGDPPKWVSCQAHWYEEDAKQAAKMPELYDVTERVVTVTPFEGQPFEMRVECSDHQNPLGWTTKWSQQRHLVVMADWSDGRHMAKVVPIPDGQTTRTLRVELP